MGILPYCDKSHRDLKATPNLFHLNIRTQFFWGWFFAIGLPFLALGQEGVWETFYERSGFLQTPRYDETVSYCKKLADVSDWVHYTTFGTSPENRALPLLIVDKDGISNPKDARAAGKAVVMVQACIHPGESEGKDAGLMLIRDMVIYQEHQNILDNITLLFIPIFNVDGHERFGPYHRINQNGPEEAGWRTTATNLNLNRDYLKADAPEMQAWLALFNNWLPDLFIDCHTSDGADYQYVLTYSLEIYGNMDEGLTAWQKSTYLPQIEKKMAGDGFPIFPYVTFRRWFDPTSGMVRGIGPPMLSQGYTALRNRPGVLIETHMLKPYKPRVESTYAMIKYTLEIVSLQHQTLRTLVREADSLAASLWSQSARFPVKWKVDYSDSIAIAFLGIGYSAVKSDLTGGTWFSYDGGPEEMTMWLFDKHLPEHSVQLPAAYIIPVAWRMVIQRLELHGVQMFPLTHPTELEIETYRFTDYSWSTTPYEGRFRLTTKSWPIRVTETFPAGSMIIPMDQPSARAIAYALEPMADGSFLNWGFFDGIFEQKEYGETYVMERLARELIAENPALLTEFDSLRSVNQSFANNQWMQLNWFYSKTKYWDPQKDKYPVGRILDPGILPELGVMPSQERTR